MAGGGFKTLKSAAAFLKKAGFEISAKHISAGFKHNRIKCKRTYIKKDILIEFARQMTDELCLVQPDVKKTLTIAERKELALTVKAEQHAKHYKLQRKINQNKYIPVEDAVDSIQMRAEVLNSDLDNFFRSVSQELVGICDGDISKTPFVIDRLLRGLRVMLGRYAESKFDWDSALQKATTVNSKWRQHEG